MTSDDCAHPDSEALDESLVSVVVDALHEAHHQLGNPTVLDLARAVAKAVRRGCRRCAGTACICDGSADPDWPQCPECGLDVSEAGCTC